MRVCACIFVMNTQNSNILKYQAFFNIIISRPAISCMHRLIKCMPSTTTSNAAAEKLDTGKSRKCLEFESTNPISETAIACSIHSQYLNYLQLQTLLQAGTVCGPSCPVFKLCMLKSFNIVNSAGS